MFGYEMHSKGKMKEEQLYLPIKNWLEVYLKNNFKSYNIKAYIGANEHLSKILIREGLSIRIVNAFHFNLKIDVFAVISKNNKAELFILECKKDRLGLIDLAQLVGYAQIINPMCALLLSPKGISGGLNKFLNNKNNNYLLNYGDKGREVVIAKWIEVRNEIDFMNCYPKGWVLPNILTR